MIPRSISSDALERLPEAIWLPVGNGSLAIYRGTAEEIVRAMSAEMGTGLSIHQAVKKLTAKLTRERKIAIELPSGLDEDRLAKLFIHALLETRLGKPMAQA